MLKTPKKAKLKTQNQNQNFTPKLKTFKKRILFPKK
jgi:hypothetical protein